MKTTTLINIVILIVLGLTAYVLTNHYTQKSPAMSVKTVPETNPLPANNSPKVSPFTFTDINGKLHDIADFKGQTVILNFWASWCAPCVKEFPLLLKAAQENPDTITLIALSSDISEEAITRFTDKMTRLYAMDFTAPNILIAHDKDQAVTAGIFQTFKLPETIIIAPDQTMRHKFIGASWTYDDLKEKISKIVQTKYPNKIMETSNN